MSDTSQSAQATPQMRLEELKLLLDMLKHHWEGVGRYFALYLIACSVLVGFGLSQHADIYNRVSSGFAVVGASILQYLSLGVSIRWMKKTEARATASADAIGISTVSLSEGLDTLRLMRHSCLAILSAGVLFVAYVILVSKGWLPK